MKLAVVSSRSTLNVSTNHSLVNPKVWQRFGTIGLPNARRLPTTVLTLQQSVSPEPAGFVSQGFVCQGQALVREDVRRLTLYPRVNTILLSPATGSDVGSSASAVSSGSALPEEYDIETNIIHHHGSGLVSRSCSARRAY